MCTFSRKGALIRYLQIFAINRHTFTVLNGIGLDWKEETPCIIMDETLSLYVLVGP